nr:acyl-CoA dehydrogenase family protein [Streptomyces europaeiscabiei]
MVQFFGGRGYVRDNPVAHLWRNARVDRFRMGISEVQRLMAAAEIDERGLSGPLRFATAPAGEGEPHTPRSPPVEGIAR